MSASSSLCCASTALMFAFSCLLFHVCFATPPRGPRDTGCESGMQGGSGVPGGSGWLPVTGECSQGDKNKIPPTSVKRPFPPRFTQSLANQPETGLGMSRHVGLGGDARGHALLPSTHPSNCEGGKARCCKESAVKVKCCYHVAPPAILYPSQLPSTTGLAKS